MQTKDKWLLGLLTGFLVFFLCWIVAATYIVYRISETPIVETTIQQKQLAPYDMVFTAEIDNEQCTLVVGDLKETVNLTWSSLYHKPVQLSGWKGWRGNERCFYVVAARKPGERR